jgi:hypothetical protein
MEASFRSFPPEEGIIITDASVQELRRMKAMLSPSGDQAGLMSSYDADVSRTSCSEPIAFTQM